MYLSTIFPALAVVLSVQAHMDLSYPPPFRSKFNSFALKDSSVQVDYSMTSPLVGDGSNFPCKGYNVDMAKTTGAGSSVATWQAGGTYNFTMDGSASHGGGSCQVALSYDQGKTFKVIHSYVGSCPLSSSYDFTVPSDAQTGTAMFAFTWHNLIGNREIYMNCAAVTISAASAKRAAPAVAFSARPDLFVANLGNGCTTVEGKELQYPDPGPAADVTTKDTVSDNSGSFTGTCAAVKGVGGPDTASSSGTDSGSNSASVAASASASTSSASVASSTTSSVMSVQIIPVTSSTATAFVTSATVSASPSSESVAASAATSSSSASASTSTGTTSSSLVPSIDGNCGSGKTCANSGWGPCCSSAGFCGSGDAWCNTGCQAAFGTCGSTTNNTNLTALLGRSRVFRRRL